MSTSPVQTCTTAQHQTINTVRTDGMAQLVGPSESGLHAVYQVCTNMIHKNLIHKGLGPNHEHQGLVINPHLTQRIVNSDQTTFVTATFERAANKFKVRFSIEFVDHSDIPNVAERWTLWIRRIISCEPITTTPTGWESYQDAQLNFLKAACLCNRVDEVYKLFNCTDAMLNEAVTWAYQYGCTYKRTWQYTDEISIGACKLVFTLQKWDDNGVVACIKSAITGTEVENVRWLTNILSDIVNLLNGHIDLVPLDIHARVCVFADLSNTYHALTFNPCDHDRDLAKKYESANMLAYFATSTVATYDIMYFGTPYTLTKRNGTHIITSSNSVIDQIIKGVLSWKVCDDMTGGPQMWAEIAAFAGVTAYDDNIAQVASALNTSLDYVRIKAAADAGRERV